MSISQRLLNLLITFNQCVFCLLCLGRSYPNETASAAAWRLEQNGHWAGQLFRPIIDFGFGLIGDKEHCRQAYENLMAGKHMPPKIETPTQA